MKASTQRGEKDSPAGPVGAVGGGGRLVAAVVVRSRLEEQVPSPTGVRAREAGAAGGVDDCGSRLLLAPLPLLLLLLLLLL